MAKDRRSKTNSGMENESRSAQEQRENLPTMPVDGPSERFQTEVQVNDVINQAENHTPSSSFTYQKAKGKGSQLKQEVAAEAITGKGVGGDPGSDVNSAQSYGLKTMSFSGDAGTLLGNVSGTPIMDKDSQGKTRVDKRLSDANKDINYLASEQVLVEYDNVPPLAKGEGTVGYNGNPKNVAARSQKKSGLTSAELLYDRSLDYLKQDQFVFSMGQVVKQRDVTDNAYPTTSWVDGPYEVNGQKKNGWHTESIDITRGNYSPRYLHLKVKKDIDGGPAYVSMFKVLEDDFSCNDETYDTVNQAASNHYIDLNCAELARQTIDQEAGSPTSEHFNPLGRSVDQPSRTVMYLRDIEASNGAEIFAAYKFAQKARGFYLNRTLKDGQDMITPALDALYGHLMADSSSDSLKATLGSTANAFFNKDGMKYGSAAIIPLLFDSRGKYKTKADFVTQARGLKLPLQTADNNLAPFRCKKEFVAALNSVDAFSTIDRGYDPMSTVEITDSFRLVHPYSWASMLAFTRASAGAGRTYTSKLFSYKYAAGSGSNAYIIKCADPLLNGIAYFAELHADSIYTALSGGGSAGGSKGEYEWYIPTIHTSTHFSLFDLLICAALPYIVYERTNTMKDVLDFQQFYKYPFPEFVSIKDANPMNAVNYGNPSALEPLQIKQMEPSSAVRWTMPELFQRIGTGDGLFPYYFNEDSFIKAGTATAPQLIPNGDANISFPVIRAGVRLAYLDDVFGFSPKEYLLCLDRLVRIPGVKGKTAFAGYTYKYSQDAEGIPVGMASFMNSITPKVVHSTPRQMGWFMPAFAGDCSVCVGVNGTDVTGFGMLTDHSVNTKSVLAIGPSFKAVAYRADATADADAKSIMTLGSAGINVSRAQAFTQKWNMKRASSLNPGSSSFDVSISFADGFTQAATPTLVDNYATFKPFIWADYDVDDDGLPTNIYQNGQKLVSMHRVLWAMIQKLPFVENPFDNAVQARGAVDPFAFAYIFNMAGFMSANYDEENYNRANERQNQGYGYTSDPFIKDSPVFRDAYRMTQIG